MRIAVWNVERGGRDGRHAEDVLAVVAEVAADLWILTEAPTSLELPGMVAFRSKPEGGGVADDNVWVAVYALAEASGRLAPGPIHPMAAAASIDCDGQRCIVYGSVLPWPLGARHLPANVTGGKSGSALFLHALSEQLAQIERLQAADPGWPLLWGGDFNQALRGPLIGMSRAAQLGLASALQRLGMIAWTADQPHQTRPLSSIDHLCGPARWTVSAVRTVAAPRRDDQLVSDHDCYVVDVVVR